MALKGKYGFSFSLNRLLGITAIKSQIARKIGIPTTKGGIERKIGKKIIDTIFGR